MRFLLALLILPAIEIALIIKVGQVAGVLATLALVILSAIIGMQLLRIQGFATLLTIQRRMQAGDLPAEEMAGSLFLALAGLLFVIPGFFTDVLGFACLLPPVRQWLARRWLDRSAVQVHNTTIEGEFYRSHEAPQMIEAQFTRESPDDEQR